MQHPARVGKYEIEAFLGGGMSHVYRAKDTVLGRRVALKVMTPDASKDRVARAKFLQEARIASSLNHDNIISIFDFGEDSSDQAARPFMVMEYVEGESLREAIKHKRSGDLNHQLQLALQAGRAIAYIHTRKIVHRDIKPENLHVDVTGKVRLMDFGVSKPDYDAKADQPATDDAGSLAVGTPFYMAPEQVLGKEPTPLTDIYAYGLMVYELLTGERPVPGTTVEEIFHHILYNPLSPEPFEVAGVPQAPRELILRCTNKQLGQRPQSMDPVCRELETLLAGVEKPRFEEPAKLGLLSPSFQRPETTQRLKMPPPPTTDTIHTGERKIAMQVPVVAETATNQGIGGISAWLRTPTSIAVLSACAVAGVLVVGYFTFTKLGWF